MSAFCFALAFYLLMELWLHLHNRGVLWMMLRDRWRRRTRLGIQ